MNPFKKHIKVCEKCGGHPLGKSNGVILCVKCAMREDNHKELDRINCNKRRQTK